MEVGKDGTEKGGIFWINLFADIYCDYACVHRLRILIKFLLDLLIQLARHIWMSNSLHRPLYELCRRKELQPQALPKPVCRPAAPQKTCG